MINSRIQWRVNVRNMADVRRALAIIGIYGDERAIHDDVDAEISEIAAKATPIAADLLVIEDSAAANAKKRITMGAIDHDALTNFVSAEHVDWAGSSAGTIHVDNYIEGGAGTDTTSIHDNVAAEISAISEKSSPVSADLVIIEDSADSNNKKRVQIGNIATVSTDLTDLESGVLLEDDTRLQTEGVATLRIEQTW